MTNENMYFISTGKTRAYYTLRIHTTWIDYHGNSHHTTKHVLTLTTDYNESVDKARNYIKSTNGFLDTNCETTLRKITKSAIDHNELAFGKYKGMTIQEVAKIDKKYLVWVAQNMTAKKFEKTIELVKLTVADEIKEAELEAQKKEQERKERKEKRLNTKHVGTVGKREEFELTYKLCCSFDTNYGTNYIYIFEDNYGNNIVWKTSAALMTKDASFVQRGETIKVKATVKEHSRYAHANQTVLTRVTVLTERGIIG